MSKGGGGGSTTTVQKADPWSGITPYLTGDSEHSGIYDQALNLYNSQGWSKDLQAASEWQAQNLFNRANQAQRVQDIGNSILSGQYDPSVSAVGNISGANSEWNDVAGVSPVSSISGVSPVSNASGVGPVSNVSGVGNISNVSGVAPVSNVSGFGPVSSISGVRPVSNISGVENIGYQSISPDSVWGGMGVANPSGALSKLLSGNVSVDTLEPLVNNAATRLAQNFNEQIMPGIRSSAQSVGQYGGSRQGIAEGLAAKGLSQSIGDMTANMYSNAYQQAQNNMATTANNISGLGLSNAQANANRKLMSDTTNAANILATQQFNSNLGLQNNRDALQTQQFNANLGLQNNQNAFQTQQFNANLGLQNNQNALQTQQFNANLGMQNNQNALQTQQFNANLGLQNNQNALQTQQLNSNIGLQNNQNALQTQQFNANLGLQNNDRYLDTQRFNASGAFDASKFNASNDLATQQFNANLGLQNNSQAMLLAQQQLNNLAQGINLLGVGNSLQDQIYQQHMGLLNAPNDYNWQNLNRYASIIQPGSGIGGSSSSTGSQTMSPLSGALGGASLGAGVGSMLGVGSGLTGTAALGAFAPWALGGAVLGGLLR